ncbi:MAG: patatin-like phospholipase family protein [Aggregatilineales bacterium]|nr:patatin-like phospholipase family protein [Aggregatilineales bacterium]HPV08343.1 patatin-like phospholipase family protein [Aggregatilineales bacterium]
MLTQPVLGLTLGGGGARGGAHIGVLRVLEEIGYRPAVITGTSIGGVIAALVAAGWSAADIERLTGEINFNELLQLDRTGSGLITNAALEAELVRLFGSADLRDFPIRTGLIAADISNGQTVLLDKGPVVQAVLATTAVPGLFPPVRWNDRLLVDGGVVSNVPTQAAYLLGAECLVAVELGGNLNVGIALNDVGSFSKRLQRILYWLLSLSHRQVAFDVLMQANILSYATLVKYELAAYPPDVLIRPTLPPVGLIAMEHLRDTIEPGERAAREVADDIRRVMQQPHPVDVDSTPLPRLVIADPPAA